MSILRRLFLQLYYKTCHYEICHSQLGILGLLSSNKGLVKIFWNIPSTDFHPIPLSSRSKNPHAPGNVLLKKARQELLEYFQGERMAFSIPLDLDQGTPFQQKAWQALREIPYGQTISYHRQAQMVGCPKGCRAIGNANGKNPIPIIIPCHRVLPKSAEKNLSMALKTIPRPFKKTKSMQRKIFDKIGGFTGGVEKKAFLLQLESTFQKNHSNTREYNT